MAPESVDVHLWGYPGDLWGVAVLVTIGVTLIALAPTKQSGERVSAAVV